MSSVGDLDSASEGDFFRNCGSDIGMPFSIGSQNHMIGSRNSDGSGGDRIDSDFVQPVLNSSKKKNVQPSVFREEFTDEKSSTESNVGRNLHCRSVNYDMVVNLFVLLLFHTLSCDELGWQIYSKTLSFLTMFSESTEITVLPTVNIILSDILLRLNRFVHTVDAIAIVIYRWGSVCYCRSHSIKTLSSNIFRNPFRLRAPASDSDEQTHSVVDSRGGEEFSGDRIRHPKGHP